MEKLRECPFDCGGEIGNLEIVTEHCDRHYVRCGYCGAQGEAGSKEAAVRSWNTRHSPAPADKGKMHPDTTDWNEGGKLAQEYLNKCKSRVSYYRRGFIEGVAAYKKRYGFPLKMVWPKEFDFATVESSKFSEGFNDCLATCKRMNGVS